MDNDSSEALSSSEREKLDKLFALLPEMNCINAKIFLDEMLAFIQWIPVADYLEPIYEFLEKTLWDDAYCAAMELLGHSKEIDVFGRIYMHHFQGHRLCRLYSALQAMDALGGDWRDILPREVCGIRDSQQHLARFFTSHEETRLKHLMLLQDYITGGKRLEAADESILWIVLGTDESAVCLNVAAEILATALPLAGFTRSVLPTFKPLNNAAFEKICDRTVRDKLIDWAQFEGRIDAASRREENAAVRDAVKCARLLFDLPDSPGGMAPPSAEEFVVDADESPVATASLRERVNPIDGVAAVFVPAGGFTMGYGVPPRVVHLDDYWIYKYKVTVGQYRQFCSTVGKAMPEAPPWGWQEDHPILNVSWYDAQAYCDWAGGQLPTDAQWEKAARGTDGRKYPWGNEFDYRRFWSSCSEQRSSTAPVGQFPYGASPYSCLDMFGNAYEWCADWYDPDWHHEHYAKSTPERNPTGPARGIPVRPFNYCARVMRGCSWQTATFYNSYGAAHRLFSKPDNLGLGTGFRCVLIKVDTLELVPSSAA